MTPTLEAPPTLSLPLPENFPGHPELLVGLKERESAKIVEGYVLRPNIKHTHLPFTFYAEININNSRLWKLFTSLAYLLPEEVGCVYNFFEQKAIYGPYMNKSEIMQFLEKFELELTQDCNMEFGLTFQTEEEFEEIFIAETKYIKVWNTRQAIFRQLMRTFGLEEIPGMKFNDEFPKTVTQLTSINANATPTKIIINEMNNFFQTKEWRIRFDYKISFGQTQIFQMKLHLRRTLVLSELYSALIIKRIYTYSVNYFLLLFFKCLSQKGFYKSSGCPVEHPEHPEQRDNH